MKLEFELKKRQESDHFIVYEVLRKGMFYGHLTLDKDMDAAKHLTIE